MSRRKPLIRSILNGGRREIDQAVPANDVTADDVQLLREILIQMEREKVFGDFDARQLSEQKACKAIKKDNAQTSTKKRPSPKHNKALKEAERAALQKPLTPKKYRQLMDEHLEILPLVYKKMDKNSSH